MDPGQFSELVAEVKARTDLVELVRRHLELEPCGNGFRGRSLKNPDRTPSLMVWPDQRRWRDYSGGGVAGGDALDFVQYAGGGGFLDALRQLAAEAGLALPAGGSEAQQEELRRLVERRRLEELLTVAATHFHERLTPGLRQQIFHERYGFSDETIDSLLLGICHGGLWQALVDRCGASEAEALATGLFVRVGDELHETFKGRAVFPYWRGGKVVYLIGRRTELSSDADWDQAKYRKLPGQSEKRPYVSPLITNDYFFGEDDARGAELLLICEGIADAISARQAGFACLSPVTTSFRRKDHEKLLRLTARAGRIVICNDSEESGAGEKGALETAQVLHAAKRDVRLATLPRPAGREKIDVNDLVREQGPEALAGVVEQAVRLPGYLLERISADTPPEDLTPALKPVFASLRAVAPIEQSLLLASIAERFQLPKRPLAKEFKLFMAATARVARPVEEEAPPSGLPSILTNDRQRSGLIAEVTEVLMGANSLRVREMAGQVPAPSDMPPLFLRGGKVVGLIGDREQPRLQELSEVGMYGLLLRVANWVEVEMTSNGEREKPSVPTADVPRDLLTYPPPGLLPLEAVVTTPVFGSGGGLIAQAGYHEQERLWLHVDPVLGVIELPDAPTADDLAEARGLLLGELLCDFPLVGDGDRAHAVAALLLPFVRRLIDGPTPLHLIEAPTAGSGKGLLSNVIGIVTTGRVCDARSLPGVEEECRKMITAELSSGLPLVLLDNLPEKRMLDSAALASVLTTEVWRDRLLGETRMLSLPNRALWLASANNARLSLELARRCVRVRIDPKRDMPWRRQGFRHDPLLPWVREHRAHLVRACLLLVQAWLVAGRPPGQRTLGSFESWARTLGGILTVAGVDGFLGNLDEFYEAADDEGESWRAFTRAWWERYGSRAMRVAELNELCGELELMDSLRGDGTAKSQQSRLGRALRTARDRIFGSVRLTLARDQGNKGRLYALTLADAEDDPGPVSVAAPPEQSAPSPGDIDPWGDDE